MRWARVASFFTDAAVKDTLPQDAVHQIQAKEMAKAARVMVRGKVARPSTSRVAASPLAKEIGGSHLVKAATGANIAATVASLAMVHIIAGPKGRRCLQASTWSTRRS